MNFLTGIFQLFIYVFFYILGMIMGLIQIIIMPFVILGAGIYMLFTESN
jgi:hypothetical protein